MLSDSKEYMCDSKDDVSTRHNHHEENPNRKSYDDKGFSAAPLWLGRFTAILDTRIQPSAYSECSDKDGGDKNTDS